MPVPSSPRSRNNSWPSATLTIAPTSQTMRVAAGESDVPVRPIAASRGQKPASHRAQW
jgi:hypothetical protein